MSSADIQFAPTREALGWDGEDKEQWCILIFTGNCPRCAPHRLRRWQQQRCHDPGLTPSQSQALSVVVRMIRGPTTGDDKLDRGEYILILSTLRTERKPRRYYTARLKGTRVAESTCAERPSSDVYCWSCRLLPQWREHL